MKRLFALKLFVPLVLVVFAPTVQAQDEARPAWQVSSFDITANVLQAERALGAVTLLAIKNTGRAPGSSITLRINSKASVKAITANGANATFRALTENRGNLQRVLVTLPVSIAPNAVLSLTVEYLLPVESNNGIQTISPIGSQFLPLSFWYPVINTPFTVRGADTAPFRLKVGGVNIISSGNEIVNGPTTVCEQSLTAQPFFLQGEWDKSEGVGEAKGITAFLAKGTPPEERKQAEALIALTARARSFYAGSLGPAPELPIRLVAVRRGAGFADAGAVLIDTGAFRRGKLDAATALLVAEAVSRLWIGTQTAVRGEGSGVMREGLARFLATVFLEKQFGRETAEAELLHERMAYAAVAKRDSPLSRATPLDDTYFSSAPNKGAMVWRLVDHRLGHDAFMSTLRSLLEAGKNDTNGTTLAAFRGLLTERGGDALKNLLDQELDQPTDTDLMVGVPQQRGGEWVAALRNLGSVDAAVTVVALTDRGERLSVETSVPTRNFADAVFKTNSRIVRVEIDPEKLYPQLDYSNDVAPRIREVGDAISEASRLFGSQDYGRAESVAREILASAPIMQEARILLARALLSQNKLDEAERLFRMALDGPLPLPATIAWANVGLGEIALKKGQAVDAARRFTDAVRADAEYGATLAARAGRIRAEAVANTAPPIDDSARAFIGQLDQAITGAKKAELDSRLVSGELVRFTSGIAGTPTEIWQTQVLRTEQIDGTLLAADVNIRAKQLGREQAGTAVLILARTSGGLKLAGIDLFEVR